jgi:GNAT superfamily N-acetyltransferase
MRDERPQSDTAFVALQGESVLGYAHLVVGRRDRDATAECGLLRFFWYEPGYRSVGQGLLETAEGHFRQCDVQRINVFPQEHRYPFYHLPSAYLSDHLGQVGALLGHNGYRRTRGEVYMDWPDYPLLAPVPVETPVNVVLEWRSDRGVRPGVVLRAFQGGRQVGECHCVSCGDYADAEEAQDWWFVKWIGVEEDVQGQGLGRYLLQRALLEMRGAGYRHAAISTARYNYRAALFYTNLGYRVVDWTYEYEREL